MKHHRSNKFEGLPGLGSLVSNRKLSLTLQLKIPLSISGGSSSIGLLIIGVLGQGPSTKFPIEGLGGRIVALCSIFRFRTAHLSFVRKDQ